MLNNILQIAFISKLVYYYEVWSMLMPGVAPLFEVVVRFCPLLTALSCLLLFEKDDALPALSFLAIPIVSASASDNCFFLSLLII